MPINAGYEYAEAEKEYFKADTNEEKIYALEGMLRAAPTHKGSEKFRGDMRLKIKKLKEEIVKAKKASKGKKGIRKEDLQAVLVGLTNSGKSSVLKALTNADPKIASYGFTTKEPEIGTLSYSNCNIQIIDLPPIASIDFDHGIVNNTDTVLIIIERLHEIEEVLKTIKNKNSKRIIVFNKTDLHDPNTLRKVYETLRTKKYNFVMISTKTGEGLEELKQKIFQSFPIIRIFTRHPGKKEDEVPVILPPGSNLKDVAEKVLHGFSKRVKFAKIWGPSAKFQGQKIGLKHVVKDKDTVELYTE